MRKTFIRCLLLLSAVGLFQSVGWPQMVLMVGDYSYHDGPAPADGSVRQTVEAIKRPARPATALGIFRYLFARYPVVKSPEGPRYEVLAYPGRYVGIPYTIDDAEALQRLQAYYNHPLPGMRSAEIGALLDLLKPETPITTRVVSRNDVVADKPGIPPYTVRVSVQSEVIPDPQTWGYLTAGEPSEVHGTDAVSGAGPKLQAAMEIPHDRADLRPETIVGKVHSRALPFMAERMGTAWCLDTECALLVTNYHVALFVGEELAVNGSKVVKTVMATGANEAGSRPVRLVNHTYLLNVVRDLAILQMKQPLSRKGMHGVSFFAGELQKGEKVTIIGYPHGKLTVTTGRFLSVIDQGALEFDLDSTLAPGCSGSVVLNTHGEAVGLLFGLSPSGNAAFAVPVWSLAEFVKESLPMLYTELFPVAPHRPAIADRGTRDTQANSEPAVEIFF